MPEEFDTFGPRKRPTIADAEWHLMAKLMRGDTVLEETTVPLRISDAWFNASSKEAPRALHRFVDAGNNIARWLDDQAQGRARREAAAKKQAKKR